MAKIVITDDASLIREMLGELVEELGHTGIGANSGEELLEIYEKEKPDVVFLDIIMDDNGLDVLEKLKKMDSNAKVVICSAIAGMQTIMEEAKAKGAVTCIAKPFNLEDIRTAIQMCLSAQ